MVLLRGPITEGSLKETWREVEYYRETGDCDITLVIDSTGGNSAEALGFIEKIKNSGINISAKIYHAESAAAFIALVANEREIVRNGRLVIHLGSVGVESCDIAEDGTIPKEYRATVKKFRDAVLNAAALPPGSYVDRLLATNWLDLSAEECLRLGIVQRII